MFIVYYNSPDQAVVGAESFDNVDAAMRSFRKFVDRGHTVTLETSHSSMNAAANNVAGKVLTTK